MKKAILSFMLVVSIASIGQLVFEIKKITPNCLRGYALLLKRIDDKRPACKNF